MKWDRLFGLLGGFSWGVSAVSLAVGELLLALVWFVAGCLALLVVVWADSR